MHLPTIQSVTRMPGLWRLRALQALARWGIREETLLIALAGVIGLVSGMAAYLFKFLLELLFHHYFEEGAVYFGATTRRLWVLPLLPALGGLALWAMRWLLRCKPSGMHGVSVVLLALIRQAGRLPRLMGLETLLTSLVTLGTGGSTGPEAPIAVIGSSVGSLIGETAGISRRHFPTLVGCGAAAGISAVFDAPIAGILFAMEVMLRDFSFRTFSPIVISSVISTTMFHLLVGAGPGVRGLLELPAQMRSFSLTFREVPYYLLLGLVCGALAISLARLLNGIEHYFSHIKRVPKAFHPALGAGLAGLCGVILILLFRADPFFSERFAQGYVPILGDGYATIRRTLDPSWYGLGSHWVGNNAIVLGAFFLLAVGGLKMLATALTVGSGGAGGIFAPSLFLGAAFGGAFGIGVRHLLPTADPSSYALVGMGAVLAAIIQAPLMAIILLFELTRDYQVMMPIMLSAVTATLLYQLIEGESLYTQPLSRQGIRVGAAVGFSALRRIGVGELPLRPAFVARPEETLAGVLARNHEIGIGDFVVLDAKGRYLGMLTLTDLQHVLLSPEAAPLVLVGEVLRSEIPPLTELDTLETTVEAFTRFEVAHLPLVTTMGENTRVLQGIISRADVMKCYHQALAG